MPDNFYIKKLMDRFPGGGKKLVDVDSLGSTEISTNLIYVIDDPDSVSLQTESLPDGTYFCNYEITFLSSALYSNIMLQLLSDDVYNLITKWSYIKTTQGYAYTIQGTCQSTYNWNGEKCDCTIVGVESNLTCKRTLKNVIAVHNELIELLCKKVLT